MTDDYEEEDIIDHAWRRKRSDEWDGRPLRRDAIVAAMPLSRTTSWVGVRRSVPSSERRRWSPRLQW